MTTEDLIIEILERVKRIEDVVVPKPQQPGAWRKITSLPPKSSKVVIGTAEDSKQADELRD